MAAHHVAAIGPRRTCSGYQHGPGRGHVSPHLRDQGLDGVEPQLVAEPGHEPHLGQLAVEVAVEAQQVGLEQRVRLIGIERGPAAEESAAGWTEPSGRSYQPA